MLLSRPPYLRWIAAAILVAGALAWEVSDRATEPYPFAANAIAAGTPITEEIVEWKQVPKGSIKMPDLGSSSALAAIAPGDPLTRSVVGSGSSVPDDWWSVPVTLPLGLARGTKVKLSLLDGSSVTGVVAMPASDDEFGIKRAGFVAVAESDAGRVALAAANDAILVLIAP
ncbi:MAG: SAF domain-containing protein [Acidimicrobiia bacterium]